MANLKKEIFYFGLLLLLTILVYNGIQDWKYSRVNDQEAHSYNIYYLSSYISKYHNIPTWTSDNFGGRPFLGLYQPAAYFIFFPLAYLISPASVIKLTTILAIFLCSIGAYLLSYKLFKNKYKAFITGLIIIFSPYFLYLASDPWTQLIATILVPFIFLMYEKFKESLNIKYALIVSLLIGLSLIIQQTVGAQIFGIIILFVIYDFVLLENKKIFLLLPLLILSIIISLFFIYSALEVQKTVNFDIINKSPGGIEPTKISSVLFKMNNSTREYIGILGIIGIIFSFFSIKNKNLQKYIVLAVIMIISCLYFVIFMPTFFQNVFQFSSRFYSTLAFSLAIVITEGYYNLSNIILKFLSSKKWIIKSEKITFFIIIFVLIFAIIGDYYTTKPELSKVPITPKLESFYKKISNNSDFFRIEDQAVSSFGFTTTISKHGILNGAPMQEAPKYHFVFWSNVWSLLESNSKDNFAGVYGDLSIKYFVIPQPAVEIPSFNLIQCDNYFCIYENKRFLSHIIEVPEIMAVYYDKPFSFNMVLQILNQRNVSFDKINFVQSTEKIGIKDLGEVNNKSISNLNFEILEDRPGLIRLNIKEVKNPSYIRISESYNSYWKAYQNNNEIKIYEGIPSTLVIPIDKPGELKVEFTSPKLKKPLFLLSVACIISIIILYFILNKKEIKNEKKDNILV
jgi:uncharacterized membrane protein